MSPAPKLAPVATAAKPDLVPTPRPRRSLTGFLVVLTILALAGGAFLFYRSRAQTPREAAAGVRTVKVARGSAAPVLRVTGTTSARKYASINAPIMMGPDSGRGLLLQSVLKSGTMLKAGDLLAQIDSQSISDHADDVLALIQAADDTIKRRKADQTIELENWRQSIRSAKAVWDKAKLDYAARAIRTEIDQEVLKLDMDEAEATYNNYVTALTIT